MLTIWAVRNDGRKKAWLYVYNKYEAQELCEFNNWHWKDKEGDWSLMFDENKLGK